LEWFSRVAGIVVGLIGLVALVGWVFDVPLRTTFFHSVPMPLEEAISFVLAGLALALLSPAQSGNAGSAGRWIALLCAAAVALLGAATLGEHLFGWKLPVDGLLFSVSVSNPAPVRVGPGSCLAFILIGLGLLLLNTETRRGNRPAELLALAETLVLFFVYVIHVFGVTSPHVVFSRMTLETWLAFLLLGLGVLFARPHRGLMAILTSEGAGGTLVRRLLPAVICIPLALGWLWLGGKRSNLYQTEVGISLVVVCTVMVLGVLIWVSARSLAKTDAKRKRAEEALRASEERTRLIVDTAYDAFVAMNDAGQVTSWNRQAEVIFGWPREEILGKLLVDRIIPPQQREAHVRGLNRFLATGEGPVLNNRIEVTALHRDGHEFPVQVTIWPVRIGHSYSFNAFVSDITQRKRTEEALVRERNVLRTLIDNLPDYVFVKDTHSRFLVNNTAHVSVLGAHGPEEVLGKTDFDYFPQNLADKYRADDQAVVETGRALINHEEFVTDHDGRTQWLLTTKVPLRDGKGEIIGLVGISRDISNRKKAEEALAQQTQELARSNAELEQFAYVASHDLQEPLRMVASYVQLLARRYQGKLDPEADEFIAFAVNGATRMQSLINDLLCYSRVGNEGPPLETTDMEAVLSRVLDNLKVSTAESGAVVTHDRLPRVEADSGQLAQLFQNLVSNAIKFHGQAPPRIHVGVSHSNGEWLFSVRDNGIGFDAKYADRIFMIFQRLHNRMTYPGTGIGLAICKKIVEHNGGRIWAESEPGQGSSFNFTLPIGSGEKP
jgi:PAS domain S-box-containing protein